MLQRKLIGNVLTLALLLVMAGIGIVGDSGAPVAFAGDGGSTGTAPCDTCQNNPPAVEQPPPGEIEPWMIMAWVIVEIVL